MIPLGKAVGIKLFADGALVVGLSEDGPCPARDCGLKEGDIITVTDFTQRPAYRFVDGRREIEPGVKEIWINAYQILEVPAA